MRSSSVSAIASALALVAAPGCERAQADRAGGDAGAAAVPVVAATVRRADVPIYLDGLGTAIASQTVPVHSQIDGKLLAVDFVEGREVRAGDVLARIDPRPFQAQLDQAEGALARDTALFEQSRLNLTRVVKLRAQNLVAEENLDDQRALVRQYQGAMRIDRGQIDAARVNLEYSRITAPMGGVTGVRLVDPGTVVHAGDPNGIVVLTQIDPVMVLFTLPQDQLATVAAGLRKGPLPLELYSRDGAQRLGTGQATVLDNQINLTTATLRLKAIVPNPERLIWPNQFVKAHLLVATRQGAIVVPQTSVERGPQGTFAFVIGADHAVSPRAVQVDLTMGELTIIASGLVPGEEVVVEGQSQLAPGMHVAPRPAADGGASPGGSN
jgi:multidrug efflux system membrane fusion protein